MSLCTAVKYFLSSQGTQAAAGWATQPGANFAMTLVVIVLQQSAASMAVSDIF